MKKQVFIKTYDTSGNFKGVFFDFGASDFTENLNAGLGDLTVTIPRKFDNYNEDGALEEGYELRVYIADNDSNSELVGSFKIDKIEASVSKEEQVTVQATGYAHELALDIVEKQTPTAHTVTYTTSSQDIAVTIKEVIDYYRTNNSNAKVNYSSDSIETTGKTKAIEIVMNSPLEVIQHCVSQLDSDWFFRIGADDLLYLQDISTTPDHYFIFGRDIGSLKLSRSLREVRNGFLFTNGLDSSDSDQITKLYSDSTSISAYGRRWSKKRDGRFKATGNTADEWGARQVALYKDPLNQVSLTVIDNSLGGGGYDIESVNVGDTFKVLNIDSNNVLGDNMLITSKRYKYDRIEITAEDTAHFVARVLEERKQEHNLIAYTDNTRSYYST